MDSKNTDNGLVRVYFGKGKCCLPFPYEYLVKLNCAKKICETKDNNGKEIILKPTEEVSPLDICAFEDLYRFYIDINNLSIVKYFDLPQPLQYLVLMFEWLIYLEVDQNSQIFDMFMEKLIENSFDKLQFIEYVYNKLNTNSKWKNKINEMQDKYKHVKDRALGFLTWGICAGSFLLYKYLFKK